MGQSGLEDLAAEAACTVDGRAQSDPPSGRLRAVLLLPESPYPATCGNALRDVQQITLLRKLGYDVTLLCVRPRAGSTVPADGGIRIELVSDETRNLSESLAERVARKVSYLQRGNAAHPFAWWCSPYALCATLPPRVAALTPTVVILRSLFVDLLPALRQAFHGKIIVDCHDADVHLAREMVRSVPWWRAAGPWANYCGVRTVCRRFLPMADEIWAVSMEDAQRIRPFADERPVLVVPSAVDEREIVAAADPGHDDVCAMVANFGYGPNLNATRWLIERVWPHVIQTRPAARLLLVGGGAVDEIRRFAARAAGITATGLLEDLRSIYAEAGVMLAPLHEGGGSRLKIVEAWKHGKAVVTTVKGIEGIDAPVGTAAIADDPREFATMLARLLTNDEERRRLGEAGRRFAGEHLSFACVAAELAEHSLLAARPLEVARASG